LEERGLPDVSKKEVEPPGEHPRSRVFQASADGQRNRVAETVGLGFQRGMMQGLGGGAGDFDIYGLMSGQKFRAKVLALDPCGLCRREAAEAVVKGPAATSLDETI
jgi:hypothetical protein